MGEPCDDVRRDHHEMTRQPVGDDATDEQEEELRDRDREDEAEVARRASELEHRERGATRATALPANETTRPANSSRNSRWRSGATASLTGPFLASCASSARARGSMPERDDPA